jgi:site-specific recombinase
VGRVEKGQIHALLSKSLKTRMTKDLVLKCGNHHVHTHVRMMGRLEQHSICGNLPDLPDLSELFLLLLGSKKRDRN